MSTRSRLVPRRSFLFGRTPAGILSPHCQQTTKQWTRPVFSVEVNPLESLNDRIHPSLTRFFGRPVLHGSMGLNFECQRSRRLSASRDIALSISFPTILRSHRQFWRERSMSAAKWGEKVTDAAKRQWRFHARRMFASLANA